MSKSRGPAWDAAALSCREHAQAHNLPCARCMEPIDYELRGNNRRAFTAGHRDGMAWDDLQPDDPRRTDPTLLQPEHRGCGATAGNHHRQGRTPTRHHRTTRDW